MTKTIEFHRIPVGFCGWRELRYKGESFEETIKRAARRYYDLFGRVPQTCYVRAPESEREAVDQIRLDGLAIMQVNTGMLSEHVWVGALDDDR